jgi:acyl carrier protein
LSDQQAAAAKPAAIIDDVRSIIAKSLNISADQLTPETYLDELGAESLDVIEIVFALEEKFDITIPLKADEATRLTTVGDVAEIVQKLIAAKTAKAAQ